jgi:tetratricopeptide (TPR) repeat protein
MRRLLAACAPLALVLALGASPATADDGDLALRWNERGITHSRAGEARKAVDAFTKALAADPENATIRRNLATARGNLGVKLLEEGDPTAAEVQLRLALDDAPDEPVLTLNLSAALHEQGYPKQAAELARKAVRLDPDLAPARERLGDVLYREGKLDEAIAAWERSLELRPKNDRLRKRLARARAAAKVEASLKREFSAHFEILYDIEQFAILASKVTRELEEAHAVVAADLKHFGPAQLKVVLLSKEQFKVSTGAHAWVGGLFDGQIRLPVRGASKHETEILAKARHEYVHAVLSPLGKRAPSWLHEGLAQIYERRSVESARESVVKAGRRLTFTELGSSFAATRDPRLANLKYDTALAFTAWLRKGRRAGGFRATIAALFKGARLDDAVKAGYRSTLPELYAEFRKSLDG